MWTVDARWWALFLCLWMGPMATARNPCHPKFFGKDAMVCVCNANYCDTMDPVVLPPMGHYLKYVTTRSGLRLESSQGKFRPNLTRSGAKYSYNPYVQYQHIKGFGGSHTDSTAINIMNLSPAAQNNLLRSYFSEEGIEYNLMRFPIGCSDFSTRPYTYDDNCSYDYNLKCFHLVKEDLELRIPLFHRIRALAVRPLSLIASPWTAPGWLKTNGKMAGPAPLKGKAGDKYHKTWANYLIRFLDEYAKHNISFWAITSQNEPGFGQFVSKNFPNIIYSPKQQRDFISHDLGPALTASRHRDTLLLMLDDQRFFLPKWAKVVIGNSTAARYVSGITVHWYGDIISPPCLTLDPTHKLFPNYFLLYTEASTGFLPWEPRVEPGSWQRGMRYSLSIATNLNSFVEGWIDWNMALDLEGGPNWVPNYVDSPILVNAAKDEFYKQPMFYHLAHFSKFVPEGSVRVALTRDSLPGLCQLVMVGFLRPDCTSVVVLINRCVHNVPFSISDASLGYLEDIALASSIQTYLWRHPWC